MGRSGPATRAGPRSRRPAAAPSRRARAGGLRRLSRRLLLGSAALLRPVPARGLSPGLADRVTAARIRIAFRSSPGVLINGLVAVVLVLVGMSVPSALPGPSALAWGAGTILLLLASVMIRRRFNVRERGDDDVRRSVRVLIANASAMAALWGSASWLLLPAASAQQEGFLLVGVAMVLMGGAGSQAVHRPLVLGFALTLTAIFAAGLLRFGDPLHLLLGASFVLFCGVVLMHARHQEAAITTAIELSMHNEELLAQRTQQQQAAEEARAQAVRADRAKTAFIAATSHDLRQPMHALVQYVAHLQRTGADPQARPTIDKIAASVRAMQDLLDAVLDFSKIALGEVKPRPEPLAIGALLERIDTQVRPLAQAKGLAFEVQPCDGRVRSDPVLLERVLRNIVQNAVRYTDAGRIVVRARPRGAWLRVLVADTGIGIARPEQARIFEEYYQVDNAARARRRGLGLGLAIVRNLAGPLGLRVRLRSRPRAGSVFAIDVPAAPGAEPPPRDAALRDEGGVDHVAGAFVVLIEDDREARDGLAMTLRDFGCRVLAAASGLEALHALAHAEFAPQLVVSDYRLEDGVDGLAAIAMVAENLQALYGAGYRLPALLVSGDTSAAELERVRRAGHPMLHKPVGPERLHDAMNRLLAGQAGR